MGKRMRREFLPNLENCESRLAATAGLAGAAAAVAEVQAMAVGHQRVAHHPFRERVRPAFRFRNRVQPETSPNSIPNTPPIIDGSGTFHFRLPSNFQDWGVVTLWNNTNTQVTFSVSASTYQSGRFSTFILNSGQRQSFFAPVVNGQTPVFQVSFDKFNRFPTTLPNVNIVFEANTYSPQATAGWPYAINLGLNQYSVAQI